MLLSLLMWLEQPIRSKKTKKERIITKVDSVGYCLCFNKKTEVSNIRWKHSNSVNWRIQFTLSPWLNFLWLPIGGVLRFLLHAALISFNFLIYWGFLFFSEKEAAGREFKDWFKNNTHPALCGVIVEELGHTHTRTHTNIHCCQWSSTVLSGGDGGGCWGVSVLRIWS